MIEVSLVNKSCSEFLNREGVYFSNSSSSDTITPTKCDEKFVLVPIAWRSVNNSDGNLR